MKRKIKFFLSGMLIISLLAGCQKAPSEEEQAAAAAEAARRTALIEVNQNDYRGAFYRTEAIKSAVLDIINEFNERNTAIESERPSDFWLSDSYKYLSVNLLNNESWFPTVYLNETETDWNSAAEATYRIFKDADGNWQVPYLALTRKEANVYELVIQRDETAPFYQNGKTSYRWTTTYKITYDANHDWAQCVRYKEGNGLSLCDSIFEYARLNETEFAIQTAKERLYIRYEDGLFDYDGVNVNVVEGGEAVSVPESQEGESTESQPVEDQQPTTAELHNPLAEKPVKEFYYTLLDGEPRYSYAEIKADENNQPFFSFFGENQNYVGKGFTNVDENANYVCIYNDNDSIFNDLSAIAGNGKEWAFAENGRFKQSISYYDSMMVVKNENNMVNTLECTNFLADGTTENFTEDIYVPEMKLAMTNAEIMAALNDASQPAIDSILELSTNGFNFGERTSFENRIDNRNFEMVDYDGKKYNTTREYEYTSLIRAVLGNFDVNEQDAFMDNTYLMPEGKMYFVSTIDKDSEGNRISDNNNYYTMFYEYEVQDAYTIKYNSYFMASDNPDCRIMLQNIKPRSTTRSRVESTYGKPIDLSSLDILDEDGLVQYTVSFPSNIAAYRCENGIIYVQYDDNENVELVGMYAFNSPQSTDTIYTIPEEEPAPKKK